MILIIDTHSIIHRSFHAYSQDIRTSKGEQVNAVYGTFRLLLHAILTAQPRYVIATADLPGGTFRHAAADEYKGTRPRAAPGLLTQIKKTKELLEHVGIPVLAVPGYEADDIIATLVATYQEQEPITILSSDNDLLQLVNETVVLRQPGRRGKTLDVQACVDKLGVLPSQVADYKALAGDSSDNIKGVKGIGPKRAAQLLQNHGSLEGIYAHLNAVDEKTRAKLQAGKADAFSCQALTRLHLGVPLTTDLQNININKISIDALTRVFADLEFKSLTPQLQQLQQLASRQAAAAERKTLF